MRLSRRRSDLRDLYFLTRHSLVNTGKYKLTGKMLRRGDSTRFADLLATTGQSDIRGNVAVKVSSGRPEAGHRPRLAVPDRWRFRPARSGPRPPERHAAPFLSDAMFNPPTLRRGDADIWYRAKRLQIGRVVLTDLAAKGTLEQGVLTVAPQTAGILAGKAPLARAARREDPTFPRRAPTLTFPICSSPRSPARTRTRPAPPATGLLRVRIAAHRRGQVRPSSRCQCERGRRRPLSGREPSGTRSRR